MERTSLPVTAAVFAGAVVLVAFPSTVLLQRVVHELLEAAGVTDPGPVAAGAVLAVSVLIGLQLATEAAALQLHGVDALNRGGPYVSLARHLLLVLSVSVVLGFAAYFGIAVVVGEAFYWPLAAVSVLVALAVLFVFARASSAFASGFRSTAGDRRRDGTG